jgi:branched-chain amino acid aminotransferase
MHPPSSASESRRMTTQVMIDGRLVGPEQALVSVFDRGFLYGDSVFEAIRTYGGVPFRLPEHLERLGRSAERVFIPLPVPLATLAEETRATLRAAHHPESYMRVMVTRGQADLGLAPDLATRPCRVIIVGRLEPPPEEAYTLGISVVTHRTQRTADATRAVGAKVANYLVSVLAMREARQVGAAEALVVDADDCVVEGTTSNVFALIGGHLVTPPEEAGILAGITRGCLLDVARELGLGVELRRLPLQELLLADEAFVSSSIRELLPVVSVDGRRVAEGRPGPLTLRMLQAFREFVRRELGSARPI